MSAFSNYTLSQIFSLQALAAENGSWSCIFSAIGQFVEQNCRTIRKIRQYKKKVIIFAHFASLRLNLSYAQPPTLPS